MKQYHCYIIKKHLEYQNNNTKNEVEIINFFLLKFLKIKIKKNIIKTTGINENLRDETYANKTDK